MYQALYRKWRPMTFADVIGQQHITDTLRAQLVSGRLSHAYLFTGTRGTGKTTCAKILARAVNCENLQNGDPCGECPACRGILDGSVLDVTEIDAASNNGVDNIRDLRDETRYTPAQVKKRVFIIDEVHMLSTGAFNALLKTLEEPPGHVLFILATTEIHKVPATILSRCQRFDFRRIGAEDIARRLLDIAAKEQIELTEGAARLIARLADGAMRDALSMLDRAAASGAVNEDTVTSALGILGQDDAVSLAEYFKKGDLAGAIALLGEYYNAGRDLAAVYDQMLTLIRDALLIKTAQQDDAALAALISPAYSVSTLKKLCDGLAASTLLAWSRGIGASLDRMRSASNRRIEAELCAVRLCTMGAEQYDSLGGRLEAIEEKLKNGVPVAVPAAAPAAQAAPEDGPPPPGDEDAPLLAEEDGGAAQSAKPAAKPVDSWPAWPRLLEALTGKINTGAHTNLKLSARGVMEDGALVLLCEDGITAMLAKAEPTMKAIREQAAVLAGAPIKVKVREADAAPPPQTGGADELMDRAKAFHIEIHEL
ncbi:DNA polymerase III subunit gamma/tau [Agathobaculum sp. NTUH-O15-33]|uniref:DNA polymerase III subunit gamma/tau n=1 Tax=Agathobaculum sp. NTUH-O15-33 TaxID=3079302 RepID=UPI0029588DCD|nr:DNA polymerase III subunit gamma/tau [Agathobaculum sp. NTUH-O15-33]WNX85120.1 DNA polymerase III subunit gamma/tau [Agathobaculum sp. NTUH-O15-33]